MNYNKNNPPEQRPHHFLFHIFAMDKAENTMPPVLAEELLNRLKTALQKKENGRK